MTAQTSGFMPRDIQALFADAGASFVHRALFDSGKVENGVVGEISAQDENSSRGYTAEHLEHEDFSKALERSKKRNASALGTPKVSQILINKSLK